MYFQQRYLREASAFPALTGLMTVDLPHKGLLSGVEFRVWGTCGAGADKPDVWLHDRLKKVEVIVNGSQVVKSYDARQLLAMMLYKRTPHYSHDMKNMASGSCEEFFHINFGRHYHDLDFMLDLSQVNDPELRIEYDFTPATQNGWDNGVAMAAAPSYSILCHLLRDSDIIPRGYIKTSEIYRFDNAANHQENMMVARGPMYSNLYLQSWYKSMGFGNILDHYEVNINSDNLIPIRTQLTELLAQDTRMYGIMEMVQEVYGKGGQSYPFPLETGTLLGGVYPGVADVELDGVDLWGNAIPIPLRTVSTGAASAANPLLKLFLRGMWPFSVAAIPLFNPWDERTWIDSSKLGDFWVRVEENAAATAGVSKLLADEVVTKYL